MDFLIFSHQLKEIRKDRNMSQKQLGDLIGVSKVSISNYENGMQYPTLEKLILLAKVLDCSLDYLLGIDYDNLTDLKRDERIFKSIKRNETIYKYLLEDSRNRIKEIEEHIKIKDNR
ncbi:MAG: helix-turn-helix transcriptional regulator [Bacilli bacterium]|nr:helix-turn-helix transcriptional regulator [Bacilli bacterium]